MSEAVLLADCHIGSKRSVRKVRKWNPLSTRRWQSKPNCRGVQRRV